MTTAQRSDAAAHGAPAASPETPVVASLDHARAVMAEVAASMSRVISGKPEAIRLSLVALLAEGHLLIEDVPGVGKTMLAKSLARSIDCTMHRIQFTPDLLPGDVTGVSVFDQRSSTFEFRPGAIFAHIVLGDEINRASPKTQSALLEAMEEQQVSVDGQTYPLPQPFMVIATQNPVEQEGTYPLPEAQLDRFLVQVDVDYPSRAVERDILIATTGAEEATAHEVFSAGALLAAQSVVRRMPVGDRVVEAILDLVRACRPGGAEGRDLADALAWGPGPRAAQALMLTVRARALLQGRLAPSVEDVAALAPACLEHRMALSFAARARGETLTGIIARTTTRVLGLEAAA